MPIALSTTPSQSKRCECVSSFGTSRQASTKARTPTGTLTKKIHSQPSESTSTPPRIGPDERRDAGHRAPEAHGRAALLGREDAGDDGHRLRRHERRAEPLHRACRDEHRDVARESAPERREGEHDESDHVDVLRPEAVAEAAGDEQRHGVGEQVGARDPEHRRDVGVEVAQDRGVRDRDDRRVDEDHEEADDECPQGGPGLALGFHVVLRGVSARGRPSGCRGERGRSAVRFETGGRMPRRAARASPT